MFDLLKLDVSGGDGMQGADGAVCDDIWQCWATVPAEAWHAHPQQLRNDLTYARAKINVRNTLLTEYFLG